MHGMGGMMGGSGDADSQPQDAQQQPKKKKRFGIGDFIGGSIPH
jgi:hypothetical protein